MPTSLTMPREVREALERGEKLEAIKRLRDARGLDLKTSKEAVEAWLRTHPVSAERMDRARRERSPFGFLGWVVIAMIVALLGIIAVTDI